MTGNVSRLPKWAQDEIFYLTRDRDHFKELLSAGPDKATVYVQLLAEQLTPIGEHVTIYFIPPGLGQFADEAFEVRMTNHGELHVASGGSGAIAAVPGGGCNSVRIRPAKWYG